ncbi:MAG: DUF2062 domain-containing protein [Candidatus Omnitrophica bacterium]|nr:DUF2062 domain-containing protein [Candidatus Omnitrophota bacterium]
MKTRKRRQKKGFLSLFYEKLFKINDTPQKIALGLGLGIFLGILPGTGPVAALTLAFILRVNRASALLGSLLVNTWLSIVTFPLSLRLGSAIMQQRWQDVYANWQFLLQNGHWSVLLKLSVLKIIFPVIVGYAAVAFILGIVACLTALMVLKYANKSGIHFPGAAKR